MKKEAACPAFIMILRIFLFFKLHQLGKKVPVRVLIGLHGSAGFDDFIYCVSALLNTLEFACSEFDFM